MKTLIVDDNVMILKSMRKIMNRIDPDGICLTADSAPAAMECVSHMTPDVAFLDIEMPGGNGLDIAAHLRTAMPHTNVVIITGHSEYAMQALNLYVSGYLLKPITEEQVRTALNNLRHPIAKGDRPQLHVKCFGDFEVWCGGEPVRFGRSKAKMLFAFLIDRNGALSDSFQILSALWPEEEDNSSFRNQLRVFLSDLQTTLTKLGLGSVLIRTHGQVGVNKDMVECDYYNYLRGDPEAVKQFHGEYMNQYSFGEPTLAALIHKNSVEY